MKKLIIIILVLITLIPSSKAMEWENFETHNLFSTTGWEKINNAKNYEISVGEDLWAMWNSTQTWIYSEEKRVKEINFKNVEKLWVGGGHLLLKYSNGTSCLLSLNSDLRKYLKIDVRDSKLYPFGAIILSTEPHFINFKNYTLKDFPGYRFGCSDTFDSQFLLYSENGILGINASGRGWKVIFDKRVLGVNVTKEYYFVLTSGILYVLNREHTIVEKIQTDANEIVTSTDFGALSEEMVDDEGKKQWIITVLGKSDGNIGVTGKHVTYLQPIAYSYTDSYLVFYDFKYIHLINETNHMCANNTFERVFFSNYAIIASNDTGVYVLPFDELIGSVKNLGPDTDLDWIPNLKDPDDDNDGMPDWWEKKYGLNPLDPSDRNTDLDGDGLTNYQEYLYGTDPRNPDTDGDGLSDGYEVAHGLNPLVPNPSVKINNLLVESIILIFMFIIVIIGEIRIKMEKE